MFRDLEKDCSHGGRCVVGQVCGIEGPGGRLDLPRISDLIHGYTDTPKLKHSVKGSVASWSPGVNVVPVSVNEA